MTKEPDIRAMSAMQDKVFGSHLSDGTAEAILRRVALDDGMELWVATLKEWRGRGIYRALTAARARAALALGKRFIHSDSTDYSRLILERYGLLRVSTTTPYCWRR